MVNNIELSNMKDYSSYTYKRSRIAYAAQCTIEYFVTLLVADAFLAKLLRNLGVEDSLIGIISSFVSLAFIIQLASIFLTKRKIMVKKIVIIFETLSQVLFAFLYFIPFLPLGTSQVKVIVMICILTAYASFYLIYNIYYKWANSFVSPDSRASFSATKEIFSLVGGIIFTALVGFVFDKFEEKGNISSGFLFIGISILVLATLNLISLLFIEKDEPEQEKTQDSKTFKEVINNTLLNKNFSSVIIMTALWNMAQYFTIGFLGAYKTGDLMISVFLIQVINILGNVVRILISKPFGRFSDKTSYATGMKVGFLLAAGGFFINIFTVPKTWYLIIIFTILQAACMAGINQNSYNISYSYVKIDYLTEAMAIKNCIGGLAGFVCSLIAGKILSYIQENGNLLFGVKVYGQQVLSLISFVLVVGALLVTHFVIEKQKVIKQ